MPGKCSGELRKSSKTGHFAYRRVVSSVGRVYPCVTPFSGLEALEKHPSATAELDKSFRKSTTL